MADETASKEQGTLLPGSNGATPEGLPDNSEPAKNVVRSESVSLATTKKDFEPPDGGWGWVVCLASFWTNGTLFGVLNTFGILYVSLLTEFKKGDEDIAFKASWIGSLQIALTFFISPISSILVDRIGIRLTAFIGAIIATLGMFISSFVQQLELLYLTYGVLIGVGSSLVYTPSMVILGHYFKKRLGMVNGFVAFGSGVATIILPFVMKMSLHGLGLRWTMRGLSVLYATLIPGCLVWKPLFIQRHEELDHYLESHESVKLKVAGCKQWLGKFFNVNIWKNKGYVVWVIALPISFLGYFVPFVHLVKHSNDVFPGANAVILVMCIGATSAVSRLICGKVADFPKVNRIRMQQLSFLVLGISTACIPYARHFWGLIIIVLVMGVCDGCFVCLLGPIAFDLLGTSGAAQGIGCLLGLMAIPMTIGPPLAGYLYDKMGSYTIAFLVSGIPPIVGSIILFLVPYKTQVIPSVVVPEALAASSIQNLDTLDCEEYQNMEGRRRIVVVTGTPIGTPVLKHRRLDELISEGRPRTLSMPASSNIYKPILAHQHSKTTQAEALYSSIPILIANA